MSATKLAVEIIDGKIRTWYAVSGHDAGTNRDIDGEYAICDDGAILDCDGYRLNSGDREEIAVRNMIL